MKTQGIPKREGELLSWSAHLSRYLCSQNARRHVDASLAEDYRRAHDAFDAAYSISPGVRTAAAVAAKNAAREHLVAMARQIVRMIQHHPATTNVDRVALGLRIPKARATRIAPPGEAPVLVVERAVDDKVEIALCQESGRCAKPKDVGGAVVFVSCGDRPPRLLEEWTLAGSFTKARLEVHVPAARIGEPIWLCAAWHNPRGERGPLSGINHALMSYSQQRLAA